ncbi:MAG: alpha/beta hydrolase [Candidatus Micrarchaeota archaeon]
MLHLFVPGTKSADSLLLLHDAGGDENSLMAAGHDISAGAALLGVRGRSEWGGRRSFFSRDASGAPVLEDFLMRCEELSDFIRAARRDYDLRRIFALSHGTGADMAACLLFLRPESIDGGILFRPSAAIIPKEAPDLREKHVWVGAGRKDDISPGTKSGAIAAALLRCGADVTLRWHEGAHEIARDEIAAARRWLGRVVQG